MNRELILNPSQSGLAYAVGSLQQNLFSLLPWLEKAYGLASNGYQINAEQLTLTLPEVYMGKGLYQIVLPDAGNVSHMFFFADGPEKIIEYQPYGDSVYQTPISIIVWVDLEKVKAEMDYAYPHRFIDELIEMTRAALATVGHYTPSEIERDAKAVWKDWTVGRGQLFFGDHKEFAQTQIFKHPEAGFRVKGMMTYTNKCNNLPLPDAGTGVPVQVKYNGTIIASVNSGDTINLITDFALNDFQITTE